MSEVFLDAVGVAAPGLAGWQRTAQILRGDASYVREELQLAPPALLPANERRRSTPTVRLAFQTAEDAIRGTALSAAQLATVFASSDADLNIIHRISLALTLTPRLISPTDFHNSVHNAASGYWGIAVGSRAASSSISAFDASFAAGLLEACGMVRIDEVDTLLVAFDLPPPAPLYAKRPIAQPAGVALVLTRTLTAHSLARLRCESSRQPETTLSTPALEDLRQSNPAARALPLLELLARQQAGQVILASGTASRLAVNIDPL